MSRIGSISSVVIPEFFEAATTSKPKAKARANNPKIRANVGVDIGADGRVKASASTHISKKSGRVKSSATVKVNEKGHLTGSVGQEVTIPVGDAQLKLGAKVSITKLLNGLVHGVFVLFGAKEPVEPR